MHKRVGVEHADIPSVGRIPDKSERVNVANQLEYDDKHGEADPRVLEPLVVDHRVVGVLGHEE